MTRHIVLPRTRICSTRIEFTSATRNPGQGRAVLALAVAFPDVPARVLLRLPRPPALPDAIRERAAAALSQARSMIDDERVQTFLRATRASVATARRAAARVPTAVRNARQSLRRAATSAVRAAPVRLNVSDDYIHGGVDILAASVAVVSAGRLAHLATRRYATAGDIPARLIRRQGVLHGSVVAVRDGDNMRIRHTPAVQRLFGLYMRPRGTKIASTTINVRLAGVDAPECGKFGAAGQPFGPVAREWLKRFVGRRVAVRVHSTDQYRRVVGTVHAKSENAALRALGAGRENVGLELVKAGYATVYRGGGAQYGGMRMKRAYESAERAARRRGVGMWGGRVVTPGEYKRAVREGGAALKRIERIGQAEAKRAQRTADGKADGSGAREASGVGAVVRALAEAYEWLKRLR